MFRPFGHAGRDPMTGVADPFSMLRHQISSVFDQFGGGGSGQSGSSGPIGFSPAIEDFSSAGASGPGSRVGKAGKAGGETGGELLSRGGSGLGDLSVLGAALPSLTQLAPRISLDLIEQPDKYIVHAEVPGVRKDDIKLSVEDGVLSITAEKKDQHEENREDKGVRVHRREIAYGTVQQGEKKEKGNVNIQ